MDAGDGPRPVFHFFRKETLVLFLCLCLIVAFLFILALRRRSLPAGVLEKDVKLENDVKIDINHAAWQELVFIRGIGPQKAQAIAGARLEHGPFRDSGDLEKVPGISTGLAAEIEKHVIFR